MNRTEGTNTGWLRKDDSLQEDFGHVERVYLVCLGHDGLWRFDVSFRHVSWPRMDRRMRGLMTCGGLRIILQERELEKGNGEDKDGAEGEVYGLVGNEISGARGRPNGGMSGRTLQRL